MKAGGVRRAIALLVATVVLGSAAAGGLALWREREQRPSSDDASIDADVVHVAPSVTGRIVKLPIAENQKVRAGDVLFEIDPEPYRLRQELARAQLDEAEALLETQRRTVATETYNAAASAKQVDQATASLQLASNTVARLEPLVTRGYVSRQQFDDAVTTKRKAETALAQAHEQAAATRAAVGNIDGATADVEARRRTLALADRDLRLTVVKAEQTGRVTGLAVATGEYVAIGQSLFTLVVTDAWFASANFRETQLDRIAIGTCATAYSMIDRSQPIEGRVEGIGWGVRDQDKIDLPRGVPFVAKSVNWVRVEQRFPVRVRLDRPPERLMRLGASAVVRVEPGRNCAR